ncbi:hypothetical protein BO82DRAFT_398824 [Aspergillus uvarum CBS 121591]|uniref:Uncharacterized protein n=1 Tax=Aspergillus uvarum CBS 121591 TaxID=1448315 RepID=A0A319CMV8_9EURO|nr:hypothetical protein BO82DRAFT_398824 [Aspergillus uvarum CBS 121591]PYH85401.1 hypothetical protein BO82DRAFT_398824 [Aspergillus uvarum CBS 121591]
MTPPKSWMLPSLVPEDVTLDGLEGPTHLEIVEVLDETAAEMDQEESNRVGVRPNVLIELLCRDTASGKPAMVHMYVQIPLTGTEWLPPSQRAPQAVDVVPPRARRCVDTHGKLRDIHCDHAPALIGSVQTKQGPGGWVPGGYVLYITLTTGREERGGMVSLSTGVVGKGAFYEMLPREREQVRLSFKAAFKRNETEWEWDDGEFRRWRISRGILRRRHALAAEIHPLVGLARAPSINALTRILSQQSQLLPTFQFPFACRPT